MKVSLATLLVAGVLAAPTLNATALADSGDGLVKLHCAVSDTGVLGRCKVVSEDPSGLGLGQKALDMARTFSTKPILRDGKPVAGEIDIPVEVKREPGQPT